MQHILIIGASSAIAERFARLQAVKGERLFLIARDPERLSTLAADLRVRGAAAVEVATLDVDNLEQHADTIESAWQALGHVDIVLLAHGTLPDQRHCERDQREMLAALQTNATATLSLLTELANRMEQQASGSIAVISSVAGDRGRQSNYVYGAAKAAVNVFVQGLQNRLASSGVQVLLIKPGFVDTPMTRDFPKGPLWVQPEVVAKGIAKAIERGRHEVYLPGFWRLIMLVIRLVPTTLFKRLKL